MIFKVSFTIFCIWCSAITVSAQMGVTDTSNAQMNVRRSEAQYSAAFDAGLKTNFLKLNMPKGFTKVNMADCDYGSWNGDFRRAYRTAKSEVVKRDTLKLSIMSFKRVLTNQDSSIVIGITIFWGSTSFRKIKGEVVLDEFNWTKNARRILEFWKDTISTEDKFYDEDKLKIWKADFGVEFSVKESPKFMGKFFNHRFSLIANKDRQVAIVYFYRNKIRDEIDRFIREHNNLLEPQSF